jgi:hypothetical protein
LARLLLLDGQSAAALDVIEEAAEISNKSEPDIRLLVAVAADRVGFVSRGNDSATQALAAFERTMVAARKRAYIGIEPEARLAVVRNKVQCKYQRSR